MAVFLIQRDVQKDFSKIIKELVRGLIFIVLLGIIY